MSSGGAVREQWTRHTLQIIVATFVILQSAFLANVLWKPPGAATGVARNVSLTHLACGGAVAAVAALFFLLPIIVRSKRRQLASDISPLPGLTDDALVTTSKDVRNLHDLYIVRTVVAIDFLQAAAFFLVVAYDKERDPLALFLAAILTSMIAAYFPTRARIATWVERQLPQLEEDRRMERFCKQA
jgi:hypothetical protein